MLDFQQISSALVGSLGDAAHVLHALSDANLGLMVGGKGRVLLAETLEDVVHDEPLGILLLFRYLEASLEHRVHVVGLEVGEIALLDASHLVVAEPIWSLLLPQLIENLGIELSVVDGRTIVDEFAGWYSDADVSAASRGVAERMLIVGGRQERGVSRTVFLALSEDRATVHLHLGEGLLELALLRRSHVSQLVDVDEEVVGKCHVRVELVGKVDVVEEVLAQHFG